MKKKTVTPPAAVVTPAAPSPVQAQSFELSADQRAAQEAEVARANTTIDTAKAGADTAKDTATAFQATNPYAPGSTGMSEFRRALTGNLAKSTAVTGDNAIARSRERAAAAGFGGGQPIQVASENELANEQAGRIASIPGQVEAQAAPLELQGQSQNLQAQGQYLQANSQVGAAANDELSAARVYNPESYYGQGTDLAQQNQQDVYQQREDERTDYYKQLEEKRKQKAGIWGSLAKIGLNVGGAAVGMPGLGSAV